MAEITAKQIKELRDRTGVGMGKCKEALLEAGGDIEAAIANLRKSGMASAAKKQGREAKEGVVTSKETDAHLAIVEINAETDFVVRNDRFQTFVKEIAEEVASTTPSTLEEFLKSKFSKDSGQTIDEVRANLVQTIGENIVIGRILVLSKSSDRSFGVYSHLGGKILTLVEISGSDQEKELAKEIAMHVAAASPDYLNPEEVPEATINNEKDIARDQVKGKPEQIIEKILTGKLNAFFDSVCLTRQKFIKDDSKTIEEIVAAKAKETGKPLKLERFLRWEVGQ